MEEEDDSAAWHQMELEQRQREEEQREEEQIARCRALTVVSREEMAHFEQATQEFHQRIRRL
jgi:hypothetical protein